MPADFPLHDRLAAGGRLDELSDAEKGDFGMELARMIAEWRDLQRARSARGGGGRSVDPLPWPAIGELSTKGGPVLELIWQGIADEAGCSSDDAAAFEPLYALVFEFLDGHSARDFAEQLAELEQTTRDEAMHTSLVHVQLDRCHRVVARAAERAADHDEIAPLLDVSRRLEVLAHMIEVLWRRRRLDQQLDELTRAPARPPCIDVDVDLAAELLDEPRDHPPPVALGPAAQPIAPNAPPARGSRGGHEMARRVLGGGPMSED